MILKDGKFYEGTTIVPLEFGNKEQIRLMNEAKHRIEAIKGDGLYADVDIVTTFTANVTGKCLCGNSIWWEIELDEEDDIKNLIGETTNCPKCKKQYILAEDEDNDTVYKLVK
jgi:hypothetical protein